MASTLLHEQGWSSDIIERQLAHAERNRIKAAYNHAEHLPERRRMMQAWADYLDVAPVRQGLESPKQVGRAAPLVFIVMVPHRAGFGRPGVAGFRHQRLVALGLSSFF
jgi:hypothetical protein